MAPFPIIISPGNNISQSEFECLKLLANPDYKWKYVVSMQVSSGSLREVVLPPLPTTRICALLHHLLNDLSFQNHDMALKTNQELIQVFKWLNGTNDIQMKLKFPKGVNPSTNWTFEALHLFKNGDRNNIFT